MSNFYNKQGSEGSSRLPDCWGHRGASAAYPENTLASFERAIRDGSEGIESDVHVTLDGVVVMFHDPSLTRMTDMTGLIREQNWYGADGISNAKTKKEPKQCIPTFAETLDLLMKEENRHVLFNVDIKVWNDPTHLFTHLHAIISSHADWETLLAPRLVLGLWHPKFIEGAKTILPYCRLSHIGHSPYLARKYFWDACDAFSMSFGALQTYDGEKFRKECKAAGKRLMVWTVNDAREMMECVRWKVDAVITDVTSTYLALRASVEADYNKVDSQNGRLFMWTNLRYYKLLQVLEWKKTEVNLVRDGGPFSIYNVEAPIVSASAIQV